ncbi:metallophosphoesterase [Sorangium sp. So ce296]|uniref:metallophosphoesterase family protein n=1 Tax=Sorangium sp. So ce296 TaxID=3133296 RepID=UPI003F602940
MTSIGWLHLSDLHTTLRRSGWTAAPIRRAVFDDLARLHEQAGPWDLVIVAGDLSMRGSAEELEEADRSLDELIARLRELGSDPCLVAVPGNHDLVRTAGTASAHRALRRWHDDPAVQAEFWGDPESPARRFVDRAFEPFEQWWKRRTRDAKALKDLRHGLLPGDFTATVEKPGVRLGIAGLCSAFLQVTGDDYEERLAISPHQLLIAAGGDAPAWVARHDAAILVTHHAPAWLAPDERRRYEAAINPAGRFCAHLSGHLHEEAPPVEQGERLHLRSPSFFGMDAWEDGRGRPGARGYGYLAARLELRGAKAQLRVFPRAWDPERGALRPDGALDGLDPDGAMALPAARFPRLEGDAPRFRLERAALRDALAAAYGAPQDARRLAREAGVPLGKGSAGGAPDVWHAVVSEAERAGKLAELATVARRGRPDDRRLADAWRVCEQAAGPAAPAAPIRRGSIEERGADELYDRLLQLDPATFEAVALTLDAAAEIPGGAAPPATRAMALVRHMELQGRPGLDRLAAALVHASRPFPATSQGGSTDEAASLGWLGVLAPLADGAALVVALSEPPARRTRLERAPTRPSLTRLLTAVFTDARDFDGFVRDHFPAVNRALTSGMGRAHRIGVLLDMAGPADVVARLARAHPSAFAAHQRVLDYEDDATDAASGAAPADLPRVHRGGAG